MDTFTTVSKLRSILCLESFDLHYFNRKCFLPLKTCHFGSLNHMLLEIWSNYSVSIYDSVFKIILQEAAYTFIKIVNRAQFGAFY
jgi:hypothetical protein